MKKKEIDPRLLLTITVKADELLELLNQLGTMPTYHNPHPEGLPELPWSPTDLANLAHDLTVVASLLDNEELAESFGVTEDLAIEMAEG